MIRRIAFVLCLATAAAAQDAGTASAPPATAATPPSAAAAPSPATATSAPQAQAAPAQAPSPEGKAQLDAVVAFLKAWGKGQWDQARTVAADKVTVTAGEKTATVDVAWGKGDVQAVLPFRGLSVVREGGVPVGVDVAELAVRIEGVEKRGKARIATQDQGGQVRVTSVTLQ